MESEEGSDPRLSQFLDSLDSYIPVLQELVSIRQSSQVSGTVYSLFHSAILAEVPQVVNAAIQSEALRAKAEQTASLTAIAQKLTDGFAGVATLTDQLQKDVFDLQIAKGTTERALGAQTDSLTALSSEASKFKSELRTKAEAVMLNDAIEQMSTYTPLRHTEKIEAALRSFPTYEDFSSLSDRVSDLGNALLEYAKASDLREGLRNCKTLVQESVRDLVGQDSLTKLRAAMDVRFGEVERAAERTKRAMEMQEDSFNNAIHSIRALVSDKPWARDVDAVAADVEQRALVTELEALRTEHEELKKAHHQSEADFHSDMEVFDSILQRFDEVMLLKASREDIKALTIQVNDPAPVSAVAKRVEELEARLDACNTALQSEKDMTTLINEQVQALYAANRAEDLSTIKDRIHELKEVVSTKVDREEVALLKEQKGDREDSDILHTNLRLHHKQLEQVTVLITATLRTLLEDTESRHQKQQQREYLLKASETLGNWVAGFDPGTYHEPLERKDLWSPRDGPKGEVSSRTRSPKETPRLPLLATSRLRTKHGRVHSQATHVDGKWPFDLLKM